MGSPREIFVYQLQKSASVVKTYICSICRHIMVRCASQIQNKVFNVFSYSGLLTIGGFLEKGVTLCINIQVNRWVLPKNDQD